jgi:hypothetical protein
LDAEERGFSIRSSRQQTHLTGRIEAVFPFGGVLRIRKSALLVSITRQIAFAVSSDLWIARGDSIL